MQTQEFFANSYCSEKFHQGLDNEILSLSVINVLFGITATVGNIVILIALHKETLLHIPSKVLLRNLVEISALALCSLVLHSAKTEANLSPSLFDLWYSSQDFDTSIIVHNNRCKRGQTFGSVVN